MKISERLALNQATWDNARKNVLFPTMCHDLKRNYDSCVEDMMSRIDQKSFGGLEIEYSQLSDPKCLRFDGHQVVREDPRVVIHFSVEVHPCLINGIRVEFSGQTKDRPVYRVFWSKFAESIQDKIISFLSKEVRF